MKKYLVSAGLFLSVVALAASSFTTHYQLEKPQDGDVNWGNSYRSNMNEIDEQMFINMSSVTAHIASVTAHTAAHISALAGTECPSATNVQEFLDCLDAAATNTVHLTGDETITGNKTFTGNNNFTGSNQFTSLNTLSGQLQLAGTGRVTFAANALHETKNRAVVTDSLGSVTTMNDISDENVQQLAGVTGNIQDQINNIINGGSGAPYVLRTGDSMSGALNLQGATMQVTGSGVNKAFTITAPASVTGGVRIATQGATAYFGTPGRTVIGSIPQGSVLVTQDDGGIDVPYVKASVTTADELAFLSGVGGLANGYPLTKNGAGNVGIIPVSSAEIYSLVGVTANVQSQLNALAAATVDVSAFVAKVGSTMTGPLIMSGATANIELTSTAELILNRGGGGNNKIRSTAGGTPDLEILAGNSLGMTIPYGTGAVDVPRGLSSTTVNVSGLTASRLVRTNGSKELVSVTAAVTDQELGYLVGVTAPIQAQLASVSVDVSGLVQKSGDTMTGKLAVINNQNGGLEIQTPSGSAGFLINRTGSSSGSFYLGTAGDRDGASTYDELQFRKGNGTSTAFTMRGYDSGVQQLLFGTSNDAYISRTGTSELGFYTAGGLRGGFYSDGTFRLYGGTSGYVGFQASSSTTSYNLTLPAVQGATNSVMENNGSGNLSWREWKPPSVTSYTTAGSNLYTVPSGARYITINMVGAGGGGGPSSNVALGSVGGSSVIIGVATATGGGAGPWGLTGATGGVSTVATSGTILDCGSTNGGYGNPGEELLLTDYGVGGNGGSSYYGGAGGGGGPVSNGQTAATASGSGGGGAGVGGPGKSGAGGGAGGYVCATVTSLSATYPVTVGAAGGGASGAGNGGSGKVVITEYYQ